MTDNHEVTERLRRKTLAEIRITSEISKKDRAPQIQTPPAANDKDIELTPRQLHSRYQHATQELHKPSLGMMLVGIMLTLTSIVLVSLCFVTTVDSYDMALNDTDHIRLNNNFNNPVPRNGGMIGGGGLLRNQTYYPIRPRITAYHFQRPHLQHFYRSRIQG